MPRPKKEGEELQLKTLLRGDMKRKFLEIKEQLGVEHYTEVIRILISNYQGVEIKGE